MKKRKSEKKFKKEGNKNIFCVKCKCLIKPKEKCCSIITYEDIETKKIQAEKWFHIACWTDFFNQCVMNKMTQVKDEAMQTIKANPLFQTLLKNIGLMKI